MEVDIPEAFLPAASNVATEVRLILEIVLFADKGTDWQFLTGEQKYSELFFSYQCTHWYVFLR